MSRWLFLSAGVLATVFGLFLAAGAHDAGIYVHGFMISGFGIALSFWLIHRWPLASPAPVAAEARELVEPA